VRISRWSKLPCASSPTRTSLVTIHHHARHSACHCAIEALVARRRQDNQEQRPGRLYETRQHLWRQCRAWRPSSSSCRRTPSTGSASEPATLYDWRS
jgi:hypothetical protein